MAYKHAGTYAPYLGVLCIRCVLSKRTRAIEELYIRLLRPLAVGQINHLKTFFRLAISFAAAFLFRSAYEKRT